MVEVFRKLRSITSLLLRRVSNKLVSKRVENLVGTNLVNRPSFSYSRLAWGEA